MGRWLPWVLASLVLACTSEVVVEDGESAADDGDSDGGRRRKREPERLVCPDEVPGKYSKCSPDSTNPDGTNTVCEYDLGPACNGFHQGWSAWCEDDMWEVMQWYVDCGATTSVGPGPVGTTVGSTVATGAGGYEVSSASAGGAEPGTGGAF
jgi:hypothetical protein